MTVEMTESTEQRKSKERDKVCDKINNHKKSTGRHKKSLSVVNMLSCLKCKYRFIFRYFVCF